MEMQRSRIQPQQNYNQNIIENNQPTPPWWPTRNGVRIGLDGMMEGSLEAVANLNPRQPQQNQNHSTNEINQPQEMCTVKQTRMQELFIALFALIILIILVVFIALLYK